MDGQVSHYKADTYSTSGIYRLVNQWGQIVIWKTVQVTFKRYSICARGIPLGNIPCCPILRCRSIFVILDGMYVRICCKKYRNT